MIQNNIRTVLEKHPIIPVVTFNALVEIQPMVEKLIQQNIHCIEITLRTPIAFEAIEIVKKQYAKDMEVGMGTVVRHDQIQKAIDLQIDFIVSPGISPAIFSALEESNIAFIPGVATPSEIMLGLSQSWDTFKFFPANLFGGIEALKAYGQLFPNVQFCPTGGISQDSYKQYLDLKNVISIGGSWMTK